MDEQVSGECFCMGAGPQLTAITKLAGSGPAMQHFRSARIEFLKGLRSLIDSRIEKMSRNEPAKGSTVQFE